MRVAFAAMRRAGLKAALRDVFGFQTPDKDQIPLTPFLTGAYSSINTFHLNGDEIEPALKRIGPLPSGYNIVVPFWELPRYPAEWARNLEKFDEVWAASHFLEHSISAAVNRPVTRMPLGIEIAVEGFRGRRFFGIPEHSYAFLCFFDCRSYITRKNPQAVVECFRRLLDKRPWSRTCLVVKLHGIEEAPVQVQDFLAGLTDLGERIILFKETMRESEVHNLIRCCDALVSLHRSEGYGHGMAEAMYLGLPVVATRYSGNLEFMTAYISALVDFNLIPVPKGDYPHAEDQCWADPDLDDATARMISLVDDPAAGRRLGVKASRHIRTNFSYRAIGRRYAKRFGEISSGSSARTKEVRGVAID